MTITSFPLLVNLCLKKKIDTVFCHHVPLLSVASITSLMVLFPQSGARREKNPSGIAEQIPSPAMAFPLFREGDSYLLYLYGDEAVGQDCLFFFFFFGISYC